MVFQEGVQGCINREHGFFPGRLAAVGTLGRKGEGRFQESKSSDSGEHNIAGRGWLFLR